MTDSSPTSDDPAWPAEVRKLLDDTEPRYATHRDELRRHGPVCRSSEFLFYWTTHGPVDITGIWPCDDCGVWFFEAGLYGAYTDPEIKEDGRYLELCECCGRKRRQKLVRPPT